MVMAADIVGETKAAMWKTKAKKAPDQTLFFKQPSFESRFVQATASTKLWLLCREHLHYPAKIPTVVRLQLSHSQTHWSKQDYYRKWMQKIWQKSDGTIAKH